MQRSNQKTLLIATGIVVLSAVVVLILFRMFRPAQDGTKSVAAEATLRLKWVVTAGFAGDYYAKHKGLFEEESLHVDIRTGGPQANPLILVAAGTDDFGVAGADAILLARSNDVPIVAIAAIFQRSAVGFFTKEESGILRPQDWEGRRVGVIPGNDTETVFRALLKTVDLGRSSVTEVPVGFDLTPFLTGQIDVQPGYMTNQPNLLRARGVEVNIIDPDDHGVKLIGNVYFAAERTLREQPDLVRRFLRAALRGWAGAIDAPDEAVSVLLAEDPKLDRHSQLAVLRDTIPFVQRPDGRLGWMDLEAWEETRDTLVEAGVLKKPVNVEAAFTNEFLPDASDE